MVEGRIAHEGSLEHGQELQANDVQVQRAGGEGFQHNEINPDDSENRMIQLWVMPEVPGQPAGYKVFQVEEGPRRRIYGGTEGQQETFAAQTVLEIARLQNGEALEYDGAFLAYCTAGGGRANGQQVQDGDLLRGTRLEFEAGLPTSLILIRTLF
jgi:redox-sensitive bicupin YhaK (pirin superfamily)